MTIRPLLTALALVAFVPAMAACTATETRESTGEYVDSAAVSTKVRTAIARDESLSIFDINVTTFRGVVQLSGFVDSTEQKARAERIAASVDGVQEVRNNIDVRGAAPARSSAY